MDSTATTLVRPRARDVAGVVVNVGAGHWEAVRHGTLVVVVGFIFVIKAFVDVSWDAGYVPEPVLASYELGPAST